MAVTPVELQKADPSWFFSNPQAIASIGDPCILPDGDGYFLYATKGGAGFYCWHTQSLHQWTGSYKTALAGTPWAQKKHWAPEVVKHDGKYVMVYSAAIAGSERMLPGIAFSCRPEGPFRAVEKPLLNLGFSAIDASLFFDDRPYLLFPATVQSIVPEGYARVIPMALPSRRICWKRRGTRFFCQGRSFPGNAFPKSRFGTRGDAYSSTMQPTIFSAAPITLRQSTIACAAPHRHLRWVRLPSFGFRFL